MIARRYKTLSLTEASRLILALYGREYTARQLKRFITAGDNGRYLAAIYLPATSSHRSSVFRLTREAIVDFFTFVPEPVQSTKPEPQARPGRITRDQKNDVEEARRLCGKRCKK